MSNGNVGRRNIYFWPDVLCIYDLRLCQISVALLQCWSPLGNFAQCGSRGSREQVSSPTLGGSPSQGCACPASQGVAREPGRCALPVFLEAPSFTHTHTHTPAPAFTFHTNGESPVCRHSRDQERALGGRLSELLCSNTCPKQDFCGFIVIFYHVFIQQMGLLRRYKDEQNSPVCAPMVCAS